MEGDQETWQLLLEVHLDRIVARFGRPLRSVDPTCQPFDLILCWLPDTWILVLILLCMFCGAPVCFARWALLVRV